jgi:integrase
VPDFLRELRTHPSVAARALEFTILTAARSSEVLGARWNEIDLDRAIWTVPKERKKGHRKHRVPLCKSAVAMLRAIAPLRTGEFVFPGQQKGKPLSNMAMEMQLRRMKRDVITVHGLRSSFRDWAAEKTSSLNHVVEMVVAHVVALEESEDLHLPGKLNQELRVPIKMMDACRIAERRRSGASHPNKAGSPWRDRRGEMLRLSPSHASEGTRRTSVSNMLRGGSRCP